VTTQLQLINIIIIIIIIKSNDIKILQNEIKFRIIPMVLIQGQLTKLIQSRKICSIYGLFSETVL